MVHTRHRRTLKSMWFLSRLVFVLLPIFIEKRGTCCFAIIIIVRMAACEFDGLEIWMGRIIKDKG